MASHRTHARSGPAGVQSQLPTQRLADAQPKPAPARDRLVFKLSSSARCPLTRLAGLSDFILHLYRDLYCNMSNIELRDNKRQPVDAMDVDDDHTSQELHDQVKTFPLSYLMNNLHMLTIIVLLHVWQWWPSDTL